MYSIPQRKKENTHQKEKKRCPSTFVCALAFEATMMQGLLTHRGSQSNSEHVCYSKEVGLFHTWWSLAQSKKFNH